MPVVSYTTICTRKTLIAPSVYEFTLKKPEGFFFKAGQFVLFDVPLLTSAADIQPRAYSIGSSPQEEELLFCIKLKPGGRASEWIEKRVEAGTEVTFKGPFGAFVIDPAGKSPHLFVGTGAGVVPFRSHLKWLLDEQKDTRPLQLLFGVRNAEDLFWTTEFERLAGEYKNFQFLPSLTAPKSDWQGKSGRVQMTIPSLIADPSHAHVFVCGAPEMVTDVKKLCVETLKMEKKQVHGEGYV
jgi:ferredoxin-NADP reductase